MTVVCRQAANRWPLHVLLAANAISGVGNTLTGP